MITELTGIPAHLVEGVWLDVAPLLEPAVERAEESTLMSVLQKLQQRDMQLWVATDCDTGCIVAACTTQIVNYDLKKAVRVVHMGGIDFPEFHRHIDWIGEWALQHGATRLEAFCRPGVTKALAGRGFKKKFDVIELDLRRRLT